MAMKTIFITGGARGIGKAIAFECFKRGIKQIVITAKTEEVLFETKEMLSKMGANILAFKADVRNIEVMKRVFNETIKTFGKIDILINNAGIAQRKLFIEITPSDWDEIIDTNLKGIFICTYLVLPYMIARKDGIIINIASGAGKTGFPELSIYCASKFGVVGFTEALAKELKNLGIKVYAVCPGGTDTRMYRSLFPERKPLYEPEKVAKVVSELIFGERTVPLGYCVEVY